MRRDFACLTSITENMCLIVFFIISASCSFHYKSWRLQNKRLLLPKFHCYCSFLLFRQWWHRLQTLLDKKLGTQLCPLSNTGRNDSPSEKQSFDSVECCSLDVKKSISQLEACCGVESCRSGTSHEDPVWVRRKTSNKRANCLIPTGHDVILGSTN